MAQSSGMFKSYLRAPGIRDDFFEVCSHCAANWLKSSLGARPITGVGGKNQEQSERQEKIEAGNSKLEIRNSTLASCCWVFGFRVPLFQFRVWSSWFGQASSEFEG
jgi:hypothetical protein